MKRIALFESSDKPSAIEWAEYAAVKLNEYGAEVIADPELINKFKETHSFLKAIPIDQYEKYADIVITFGGDGTMLSASRLLMKTDIPIMGVNVGRLGFLAEYSTGELDGSLRDILDGQYRVIERSILECEYNGQKINALNDVVIEKKNSPHMITIQGYANEYYIGDYRADGLIITTPTGSTAYSLSCGGPILAPSTEVWCLTPISPHSLTVRPLVISDNTELRIKIQSLTNEASLVADGQVQITINSDEFIHFRRSASSVKLIKKFDSSYYDLLRRKLLWAVSATDKVFTKDCD